MGSLAICSFGPRHPHRPWRGRQINQGPQAVRLLLETIFCLAGGMSKTTQKFFVVTSFVIYLVILLRLLVFRYSSSITFDIAYGNFVPFKTILNYLNDSPAMGMVIRNLVGNILIFVPLGFFVPLFRRSSNWMIVLAASLIISFALEAIQGIFGMGVFDVDDILLNTLGAIIGYGIFVCIKKSKGDKIHRLVP
jgi:glycopeptide antibiotics resistance protein